MDKPSGPTKGNKEVQIRTPLRFLDHAKLRKNQQLETVLRQECLNSHSASIATTTYIGKIFNDRIEFAAEKNAKKPPIKKIKFTQVERIIPNDDDLCVHMGWRQGKSALVTSFAFTEQTVYNGFINNLENKRGFVPDSKNRASQSAKAGTSQRISNSSPLPELKENLKQDETASELPIHRLLNAGYATSYIMWEEPEVRAHHDLMSTDLHMPINKASNILETSGVEGEGTVGQEEEEEEEQTVTRDESADAIHHCPCCVQRSGINLKLSNHHPKAYAPSSEKCQSYSNFPVNLSHNYKCYRPHHPRTESSVTRESFTDYDESTLETLDDSDSAMLYPPRSRPRSLPPPIDCLRNVARPAASRQRHQPTQHRHKNMFKEPRRHQRTWTIDSSSSSGYTSSTFHEDSLELIVDPTTAGQYIRNQKRYVTGRVRSKARKEPVFYYRKNIPSLPPFPRVRNYDQLHAVI
uniref:Uncharacterized protein n=1 Tax=Echinococcus granulosus TaxID=6210 RepID=A0A068WBX2_ECHGR|nr:hypothetical protein EgrG_000756500 [Echinococcus granulosus]